MTQLWQHEETGRTCALPFWRLPGKRWYKVAGGKNVMGIERKPGEALLTCNQEVLDLLCREVRRRVEAYIELEVERALRGESTLGAKPKGLLLSVDEVEDK